MFGFILALFVSLMQAYVFWRASSIPTLRRLVSVQLLIAGGLVIWVLFILSRYLSPEFMGGLATPAERWSMAWLGTLFLITVALLFVEVGTGFGFFLKQYVPRLRGLALLAGVLLSLFAAFQGDRAPIVQAYEVYATKLPKNLDGTVIVVLSDLHLGAVLDEKWLAARVAQVWAERPDVILLLGDIFESHGVPSSEMITELRQLSAPLGVWGVLGNHESHGSAAVNAAAFGQAGVRLLRNTWALLSPGLVLAGVDNLSSNQNAASFLESALDQRPLGATVFMSHAPLAAELASSKGVDLMLSGHTHGGQIWPFGYLVQQQFHMLAGKYDVLGMTAIVSGGTGTWGPRMRLWQPAEILRITLHAGSTPL